MSPHVRRISGVLLLAAAACSQPVIEWEPAEYHQPVSDSRSQPADDLLCAVEQTVHGAFAFRAGWERETGALAVRKSEDGGRSWGVPVPADRRVQEAPPCERVPPALFVDSTNAFLHVAYFAEVRGEPGVYYVHSMNAKRVAQTGEGMFERPIPLTFGTRPARTAVASRGDTVAVAYQDPNSPRGGVHLALSVTAGHSFAHRLQPAQSAAAAPAVQLRGGRIRVEWTEASEPRRRVSREGTLR